MYQPCSSHPYLCSELVSIAGKQAGVVPANLEAIGERSALVLTDLPLRRGSEISISGSSYTLRGTVRTCHADGPLGYYADVRLDPGSRWSKQWFVPQHLLAVGTAARREESGKGITLEKPSGPENFIHAENARNADFASAAPRQCNHAASTGCQSSPRLPSVRRPSVLRSQFRSHLGSRVK